MNKVVVVTGGSVGIGKAIVTEFAKNNYNVIINYNTHEREAEELKKDLEEKYHIEAITIKADISKEDEVINLVNKIKEIFGNVDVLINNAGIAIDNFIDNKTTTEFKQVIETNILGTFLCSKYISKIMNSGNIINISSTNGIDTYNIYSMDYDASKAGVISLTHNFAKELAPNIRVNAIAPGWVETESVMEMDPNLIKDEKSKILLQRFGQPEEIAKLAFFIAEDGTYINNSVIRIDGGIKNGD